MLLAHQLALSSPLVSAEMIAANDFPDLSAQHEVHGVPQTTINNGKAVILGAVPEHDILAYITKALQSA